MDRPQRREGHDRFVETLLLNLAPAEILVHLRHVSFCVPLCGTGPIQEQALLNSAQLQSKKPGFTWRH